ncbi:hypothetical protein H0H92_014149 [Tricholoma furcatifolium]|nr:hypothetical protein H0H92_014149 [Tricholoma furcatifolium]
MSSENTPAGSGSLDLPYVYIRHTRRQCDLRSPLADRSNYTGRIGMSTSVSYPSHVNVSITRTTAEDDSFVVVTPRVKSFQLPPLPCTSSLQLHSFLKSISASPVEKPTPHLLSFQNIPAKTQSKVDEGGCISPSPILIQPRLEFAPRFVHPNSPYVPWTPEARREILRPLSSNVGPDAISSENVKQPPQSAASHIESEAKRNPEKLPANLRNLSTAICRNLKKVALKISKRKKSTSTTLPTKPAAISHALISNSFESADTTSLYAWLSDCRQLRKEAEKKAPSKEMTLDKYEEMGSWTQLPVNASPNNHDHFIAPHNFSPQSHLTVWPGSLSVTVAAGSPQVGSSHLGEDSSVLSRETSMPGGWTFG